MKPICILAIILALFLPEARGESTYFKKYPLAYSNCGYSLAISTKGMIGISGLKYDSPDSRTLLHSVIDPSGKLILNEEIDTGNTSDTAGSLAPATDGGFVLASSVASSDGTRDIVVIKIRADGSVGWKTRIAASASE